MKVSASTKTLLKLPVISGAQIPLWIFCMLQRENSADVINLFTRIWDISALGLIIEEAGGVMKYVTGDNIKFRLD